MAFSFSSAINSLVAGTPENVADVVTCLNDVKAVLNNGITGTDHLSPTAAIADTQLASPNNVTYKRLQTCIAAMSAPPGGTYMFNNTGTLNTSGASLTTNTIQSIQLVAADLAVAGKTTKLRIRAQISCNATAPAITFTFGLYPYTVAGGANTLVPTFGTVVAGSTVAVTTPSASTVTASASSDVTIPADGAYALGVVLSGGAAANSFQGFVATLDARNV